MNISASLVNEGNQHTVVVQTNETSQQLTIPSKSAGHGSAVNGGELLCLALATCFCNDLYREARKAGIKVNKVTVEAWGKFGSEGEPGREFYYRARVDADAPDEAIAALISATDQLAEIQKTIRNGASVKLIA